MVRRRTKHYVLLQYAGPAYAKQPDPTDGENFEVYTGTVTPKQLDELHARSNHAQDHRIRPPQR